MKHYRRYVARTVLVTLRDGTAMQGTLAGADRTTLTLDRPTPVGQNQHLDGVVVIPEGSVSWVQVV